MNGLRRSLACLLVALLAGCAPASAPPGGQFTSPPAATGATKTTLVDAPTGPPELASPGIRMKISSWGKLVASFNANAAGDIEYRESSGSEMYEYDVNIKRFNVGARGFSRLQDMAISIAERVPAGGEIECGVVPTDQPYGLFEWNLGRGSKSLSIRYGCQTEEGRQIHRMVDELEKVVVDWAARHPIGEVEQVRRPG